MSERPALALLVRARIVCEDGDFKKARDLVERALDLEPENADGYVVSLMAHFRAKQESELADLPASTLAQHPDYSKAQRFGHAECRRKLEGYAAEARILADMEQETGFLRANAVPLTEPLTAQQKGELKRAWQNERERRERDARLEREVAKRVARRAELTGKASAILNSRDSGSGSVLSWDVVDVHSSEPHVLVVSSSLIGNSAWTSAYTKSISWRTSSLREWLNTVFLTALPDQVRTHIVQVDNRPVGGKKPVLDSVFVPSQKECSALRTPRYYWETSTIGGWSGDRQVNRSWWLRDLEHSSSRERARASAIDSDGKPVFSWGRERADSFDRDYGAQVGSHLGVRPAFWLNVESQLTASGQHASGLVDAARDLCRKGLFSSSTPSWSLDEGNRRRLDRADGCVRLAVAIDASDADAHLVGLMVEYRCRREADLGALVTESLPDSENYQSAWNFGDKDLRDRLDKYAADARSNARQQRKHKELAERLESIIHDPAEAAAASNDLETLSESVQQLTSRRGHLELSRGAAAADLQSAEAEAESLGPLEWGRRRANGRRRTALLLALDETRGQLDAIDRELASLTLRKDAAQARFDRARLVESLGVREVDDQRGRVLVVATASAWTLPYNAGGTATGWNECTLRTWLQTEMRRALPLRITSALQQVDHGDGAVDELFLLTQTEARATSNVDGLPVLATTKRIGRMWARKPHNDPGGEIFQPGSGQWGVSADSTALVVPAMWVSVRGLNEAAHR